MRTGGRYNSNDHGQHGNNQGEGAGGQLSTSETKTVNLLMHLSDMLK